MIEVDVGGKVVEKNRLMKVYIKKMYRVVVVMVFYWLNNWYFFVICKLCVFEIDVFIFCLIKVSVFCF